jgi:hypothetical protein
MLNAAIGQISAQAPQEMHSAGSYCAKYGFATSSPGFGWFFMLHNTPQQQLQQAQRKIGS